MAEETQAEIIQKGNIQYDASGLPADPDSDRLDGYVGQRIFGAFMSGLVGTGCSLPPHGSKRRDAKMRKMAEENESLQSVLFTISLLLYNLAMSIRVVPDNNTISMHKKLAEYYQDVLEYGLNDNLEKFISDYLITDNGAFLFIEAGDTPYHEPARVPATGLRHLDSLNVTRTRNSTYPVVYTNSDTGSSYPIHASRIIQMCQFKSADWQKNGIGHSSVSRLNQAMTHLDDVMVESLERLGSLESNKIIHATASSAKELTNAISTAEIESQNEGRTRSGRTILLASRDPNAKLNLINLKEGESGSDKVSDIEVTLSLAALALGVNTFTLLESTQSSSTRAAATQSIKMTDSKLLQYFYNKLTAELSVKLAPKSLKITQTGEDKDLDGTKARISLNRATTGKQNIESGVTTTRVEREKLLSLGELTPSQFEALELSDERLPNGLHISTLFYNSSWTSGLLQFNYTDDPLHEEYSDEFIAEINSKTTELVTAIGKSISANLSSKLTQALYAVQWLENQLQSPDDDIDVVDIDNDNGVDNGQNLAPRTDDIVQETERDRDNENEPQDVKSAHEDWLYDALMGDMSYVAEYSVTKESPRRFQSALRSEARGLWSKDLTKAQFKTNFAGSLTNLLTTAYDKEFKRTYDGTPDRGPLNEILDRSERYIDGFAEYISNNQRGITTLKTINSRVDLWLALHDEVISTAKLDPNGEDESELIWRIGGTHESCGTCLKYSNTVKSKKAWAELANDGIKPQGRGLECSGYKCQCSLQTL